MPKAADAFRTISEVAESLDIPKHVLRFWELRFPQIKPMKRGGGRRYYRPADVELLRGIRNLLHAEGYTIKGVQKILREQGVEHVKAAGRGEGVEHTPDAERELPPLPSNSAGIRSVRKGAGGVEPSVARSTREQPASGEPAAAPPAALRPVLDRLLGELQACRATLARAGERSPQRVGRRTLAS